MEPFNRQKIINTIYESYVVGDFKPGVKEHNSQAVCAYGVQDKDGEFLQDTCCFIGRFIPKTLKFAELLSSTGAVASLQRNHTFLFEGIFGEVDVNNIRFLSHVQFCHDDAIQRNESISLTVVNGKVLYRGGAVQPPSMPFKEVVAISLRSLCEAYQLIYPGDIRKAVQ